MKKTHLFIVSLAMSTAMCTTALAGEWKQDATGYWYQNDDNSFPTSTWQEIDGKQYYFNENGYMLANTTTPDGKQVDADGALIQAPLFEFDTDEWHVKYTNYELSTDYEGNSCIIIYYDFTNKDNEPRSAMSSWIGLNAYQNGVQCSGTVISSSAENKSIENEYKEVMSGITINVANAFSITDLSALTLIVKDPFDWTDNAKSVTATLNINE